MNVFQLIQTLVATIVGGLIVIATNWISQQEERRGAIQEWYEKTYVTDGLDQVVAYFFGLGVYFGNKSVGGFVRVRDIDTLPVEAIIRLEILLADAIVFDFLAASHQLLISQDQEQNEKAAQIMYRTAVLLLNFRKELLKIIATKVSTKHYTIDASSIVEKLYKEGDEMAVLAGYERLKREAKQSA